MEIARLPLQDHHASVSNTDEWVSKVWYIYTMKYYSAMKWNKVLIHATSWMNLQIIMLCERNKV